MAQVQHADPRTRQVTLICLLAAAGVGATTLFLLERYRQPLFAWLLAKEPHVQVAIILVALCLLLLPLLVMAAWLWRYGGRVRRESRHPPQDVEVIRDTPILDGPAARLRGRLYQALAALFAFAAIFIISVCWMLWRLR